MGNFLVTYTYLHVNGTIADADEVETDKAEILNGHNGSMDGNTGHGHTGAIGDGPKLDLSAISSGVLDPAHGGTGTSVVFTPGSVIFAGPGGVYTQDNASFFWNDALNRLGIGGNAPLERLHVFGNIRASQNVLADNVIATDDVIAGDTVFGNILQATTNITAGGNLSVTGTGFFGGEVDLSYIDPPTSGGKANANSLVSAKLNVSLGGGFVANTNGEYNIQSVVGSGPPGQVVITFSTPFTSTDYAYSITPSTGAGGGDISVTSKTANSITIFNMLSAPTEYSIIFSGVQ